MTCTSQQNYLLRFLLTILSTIHNTHDSSLELISDFNKKSKDIFNWISLSYLSINWLKTKFIIFTNKRITKPDKILINNNQVERVVDFKLLGCMIDESLSFANHVELLRKTVFQKLHSIKSMFFLHFHCRL